MNREQMVNVLTTAIYMEVDSHTEAQERAFRVVDLVLPQVTTMAELEALPDETGLVAEDGRFFRAYMAVLAPNHQADLTFPLTVVWQPEVTA